MELTPSCYGFNPVRSFSEDDMRKNFKDMSGLTFGRWTVVALAAPASDGTARWLCRCSCGVERVMRGTHLRSGRSAGCAACGNLSKRTHGECSTRLYDCWRSMKNRANGTGNQYQRIAYANIDCCPEWDRYEPFRDWAKANGYEDHLTLDRIDNTKGYSPDNCQWATPAMQARNTQKTVLNEVCVKVMRYFHYEKNRTIADIARVHNLNYITAYNAIRGKKWRLEQ